MTGFRTASDHFGRRYITDSRPGDYPQCTIWVPVSFFVGLKVFPAEPMR